MSDIKLYKLNKNSLEKLDSGAFQYERELQKLIEDNMEAILGIKFLQSEYSTGKEHGGRIDSLGIDENSCPVIIEYKRSVNENVINQGLFYLDWLMDHKAAFKLLVMDKLGQEYADDIEWSIPRLLCIASDFTKYDEHAVKQMDRNIELIRYKKYDDDILLLEQVVAGHADTRAKAPDKTLKIQAGAQKTARKTFGEIFSQVDDNLKNLYHAVADFIESLGDDVQKKEHKYYVAFKRIKNFTQIQFRPQKACLHLYLHLDLEKAKTAIESGLVRNISSRSNWGVGNLEATISNMEDFEKVKHLVIKSYEAS